MAKEKVHFCRLNLVDQIFQRFAGEKHRRVSSKTGNKAGLFLTGDTADARFDDHIGQVPIARIGWQRLALSRRVFQR
jgi:hypothetical protein